MFDFDAMLRRAVREAGALAPVVAMPYDAPERVCCDLMAEGVIGGFVADKGADQDRRAGANAGWWVDRKKGLLCLRRAPGATLLIAGADRARPLGTRLLLEARLKGYRRLISCDSSGQPILDVEVEPALFAALDASDPAGGSVGPSFQDAFAEMFEMVGDMLRLPSDHFDDRRVALALGTLGPGGAERQGAFVAAGAAGRARLRVDVLCNHLSAPADFHRPLIEKGGAHVHLLDEFDTEPAPALATIRDTLHARYGSLGFGDVFIHVLHYVEALRRLRPQVVHCWMDYCNVLCGAAAVLVGVPGIVLSCRSVAPNHFRLFQPYMRAGYEAVLQRRRVVLLNNSRAGARDYAQWLGVPESVIRVIHNGFEFPQPLPKQARRKMRETHGIAPDAPVVGTVIRFSEEKRPRLLVDTAAEIHAANPACRFLLFGGGVMLDEMRAEVAGRGLQGVIHLPGVTHDVWSALAAMDLFLLVSRMEGLPNVLVEAQAAGVPIVCTGVGGMSETFIEGETGLSVPEATPSALARAAQRILSNADLRRTMSRRAFEHARAVFDVRRMLDATLSSYREAARLH